MEPTNPEKEMQTLLKKLESNPQSLFDMFADGRKELMESLLKTFEKEFSRTLSKENLELSKSRIREAFKNINPLKDLLNLPTSQKEIFTKEYVYFQEEILSKPTFPKVLLVSVINDLLKFITPTGYSIDPDIFFEKDELKKIERKLFSERQKAEDSMEEFPQAAYSKKILTICKYLRKSNLFSPSTIQITHLLLNDQPELSKPHHGNSMPINRSSFTDSLTDQLRLEAMVAYIELAPKHQIGRKMADYEKETLPYCNQDHIREITTTLNANPSILTPSPISKKSVYAYIRDIFYLEDFSQ